MGMAQVHSQAGEEGDALLAESQATIGAGAGARYGGHVYVQESSPKSAKKKKGAKKRHANTSTGSASTTSSYNNSGSNSSGRVQYPFPASSAGADENEEEAMMARPPARRVPQMRTAKARDGGRTQSGGVRGVPADDLDDQ